LKLSGVFPVLVGDIRFRGEEGPAIGEDNPGALDVLDLHWSQGLVQLGRTLDRLFQILVRGVEGEDDLALAAPAARAHLTQRLAENLGGGKRVRRKERVGLSDAILALLNLLSDLSRDRALLELGDVLTEGVLERLGRLDDLRELEAFLRLEGRLPKEIVV